MKNTILKEEKWDRARWITVCSAQWKFRKFKERKQINPIDTEQLSKFYLNRTRPDIIA